MVRIAKLVAGMGIVACLTCTAGARADVVRLSEGFDGAGIPAGWVLSPTSTLNVTWQKPINVGTGGVFAAQSGAPDSYLFNSYNSTPTSAGAIDDFLITPTLLINNGTVVSFYVKADPSAEASFPDRLRVLLSTSDTSTAISAFTRVIADINPNYSATGFPQDWTLESFVVSGLTGTGFVSSRFAFEYLIDNTDSHGDFIGLDTVRIAVTVPEPDSLVLASIGFVALAIGLRGRARRSPRTRGLL